MHAAQSGAENRKQHLPNRMKNVDLVPIKAMLSPKCWPVTGVSYFAIKNV